jgi:hypothetical protein
MRKKESRSLVLLTAFLAAVLALAGCSSSSENAENGSPAAKDAPKQGAISKLFETTQPITVPAGTAIHVTLETSLNSAQNRSGDEFEATVSAPVVVSGKTVIPKGARARGAVVDAKESGRLKGVAHLTLALRSVEVGGKAYELRTSSITQTGSNHNKRNVIAIGGGAGLGALIGGIAGGGKGAAIGAGVGAGAGTAGAAVTGKKDITIPVETPLNFQLKDPVTVPVKG